MNAIKEATVLNQPFFIERNGVGQYVLTIKEKTGQTQKIKYPSLSNMHLYALRKNEKVDVYFEGETCVAIVKCKKGTMGKRREKKPSALSQIEIGCDEELKRAS